MSLCFILQTIVESSDGCEIVSTRDRLLYKICLHIEKVRCILMSFNLYCVYNVKSDFHCKIINANKSYLKHLITLREIVSNSSSSISDTKLSLVKQEYMHLMNHCQLSAGVYELCHDRLKNM